MWPILVTRAGLLARVHRNSGGATGGNHGSLIRRRQRWSSCSRPQRFLSTMVVPADDDVPSRAGGGGPAAASDPCSVTPSTGSWPLVSHEQALQSLAHSLLLKTGSGLVQPAGLLQLRQPPPWWREPPWRGDAAATVVTAAAAAQSSATAGPTVHLEVTASATTTADGMSTIAMQANSDTIRSYTKSTIQSSTLSEAEPLPSFPSPPRSVALQTSPSTLPTPDHEQQPYPQLGIKHPLVSKLIRHLHDSNHQLAMDSFSEVVRTIQAGDTSAEIPPGIVKALFRLICPHSPFDAYRVLSYYVTLTTTVEYEHGGGDGDISVYAKLYERACDAIRHLDPKRHSKDACHKLVRSILATVQRFDRFGQELCLPTLVSALVEQKSFSLGQSFAGPVYRHLMEQPGLCDLPGGFWVHLLSHSRYNRQLDLPFDDVMTRMVDACRRPQPDVVLSALDNLFPFTNTVAVTKMLQAILRLQQQIVEINKNGSSDGENGDQYYVDMGTLEMIGAAAASQGQSDVNLLIWDMLDILGYQPTVGVYENTVAAFAMNTFTYREAFTVLVEMEDRGFKPSRALLRTFSTHLRASHKNLDFALEQLKQLRQEGKPVTTSSLNAIMSGAAERGDIDRILSLLQEFDKNNVEPDAETFSFGFESLGKNLRRRTRTPATQSHRDACLVAAESFLTMMDERDIDPTLHIIHDYIELLCLVDQVDTATTIALEASGENSGLLGSKTIYRVAMANASLGQFDIARKVARCGKGEPMPHLLANIDREEADFASKSRKWAAVSKTDEPPVIPLTLEADEAQQVSLFPAPDEDNQPGSPPTFWKRE